MGIEPDAWQRKVLDAFPSQDPQKKRISLQSCAGPGKSAVLAWCGLNFLSCYGEPGEHPKGAAVSITQDNLKDCLWAEFSKWIYRSKTGFLKRAFQWTKERIYAKDHPETWFLSARSWSKNSNPEEQGRTLSGLHSKYVLCLIDESGEIPIQVLKAAEQSLSNCKWAKIMQAGNPTSHDGMLYAAATNLSHQWFMICVTGDPDDPDRSPRIDIEWAREQIKAYGRDNGWVISYLLGQFPPSAINTLLSPDEVDTAMKRIIKPEDYEYSQKRLGIDVARGGLDKTSLFPRQGLRAFEPAEMRNAKGHEVAARAGLAKERWNWEICFVDDTGGYGGSVCDSMIQGGLPHIPVNFAGSATDPRYFNKRSEIWFRMADWIKRGGALPNLPELKRELTTPTYSFQNGKFRLEEKEQIKKRLGFSCDDSDSLALTFSLIEKPGAGSPNMILNTWDVNHGKAICEFDPFRDVKDEDFT